jgi:hypothetical protein
LGVAVSIIVPITDSEYIGPGLDTVPPFVGLAETVNDVCGVNSACNVFDAPIVNDDIIDDSANVRLVLFIDVPFKLHPAKL